MKVIPEMRRAYFKKKDGVKPFYMTKPIESQYQTNVIIEHGTSHVPFEVQ